MSIQNTTYPLVIDGKIPSSLNTFIKKGKYSSFFIICDSNSLKFCLSPLLANCSLLRGAEIIELEPGEENKDLAIVANIWQTLTESGADKKTLVVNLGGGVVSDTGGFAASVFKRGIPFINIPTTLLSMADASVGGKTGVNFSGIKNHIGTITQPCAVYINTGFLNTLPHQHLVNGFAEIIKIALVKDKAFFKRISALIIKPGFHDPEIIRRSVELKNLIVKKDPEEKGLRRVLNFGHTAGHAIESVFMESSAPLLHGQAVAAGMAIESYLCLMMKRISKTEFETIIRCLHLNFIFPALSEDKLSDFFRYFSQDKKHSGKNYTLALLKGIGTCDDAVKVSQAQMEKAIAFYNSNLVHAPAVQ